MKQIVKIASGDMQSALHWKILVHMLDPCADPSQIKAVELTVDSCFFEPA